MKKLLLIPTMLFPYTACAPFAYGFIGGSFAETPFFKALMTLPLICFFLAIICNIIFMVISAKDKPEKSVTAALIVKIVHVPTYVVIFLFGLLIGLFAFIFAIPIILLMVLVDILTLFLSGMISVYASIRSIKIRVAPSVVSLILQFFFCADIISLIVLRCLMRKDKTPQNILPSPVARPLT